MSTAPLITIFVRHSKGCKYAGDEFCKRCRCRKHMRWTQNGKQYRRKANTRSWEEAEQEKRRLEGQAIDAAVKLFLQDKTTQGLSGGVLDKYSRELKRLQKYCESAGAFVVQAITKELLSDYCATWPELYPSTATRAKVRERCRAFLRYSYEAQWLIRVPALPKIKVDEPPTMPLTAEEYARLAQSDSRNLPRQGTARQGASANTAHALVRARYCGRADPGARRDSMGQGEEGPPGCDGPTEDGHACISAHPRERSA